MYSLKNYMEDVVRRLVDKYAKEENLCSCEKCRLDVIALALNELPTAYVVTKRGELLAAVDAIYIQNKINAEIAVLKAIRTVKANPQH